MIKPFSISARVRQGYLLNTFIFLMVLDWVSHQALDNNAFAYLESLITTTGSTEENVQAKCRKVQVASSILRPIGRTKFLSPWTKIKIFNSTLKSVLLYGSDTKQVTNIEDHRPTPDLILLIIMFIRSHPL